MARAESARLQRYVFTIAAAAGVVVAGGAAATGLLAQAGPAMAALRQHFLP